MVVITHLAGKGASSDARLSTPRAAGPVQEEAV
jgi:hypothetical protein